MERRIIKLHKITMTLSEIIIKFGVTWWEASFAVRLFLLPAWPRYLRYQLPGLLARDYEWADHTG